jgi:hypothetical protein
MNERIFELAHQAGFNTFWNGAHIVFDVSTKENMKEFAEMLIQECCEVINAARPGVDQLPPEVALDMAAKNVKAYFGV